MPVHRTFAFGPFSLRSADLSLLRDGQTVPLNRKAMQTLLALVEEHGNVVSKEQLLERIWRNTFVEEGVLSRNICDIRRALGDGNGDAYIQTVPKRGYRFVHQVTVSEDNHSSQQAVVLAVLPFRVIEQSEAHRYLGLALADAVIARLGSIRSMVVRPTSSVARYAEKAPESLTAARELDVNAVLEGTVRVQGDRIRLIVHLVSARDNAPLWSNTFDCPFENLFELEDRVAVQVAAALVLRLSSTEKERIARPTTRNPEAYRLYLQARYYFAFVPWHDLTAPLRCLEEALQLDPEFADCHAAIATWYTATTIHGSTNPNEMVPKAKEAALRALQLDPHQQQARAALAFATWHYDYDWGQAEIELRRMVSFAPNDALPRHILAMMLAETHRDGEAMRELELAQQLEPSSSVISSAGLVNWMVGRYDQAIERSRAALRMDQGCVRAMWTMGMALEQLGKAENAVKWLRKAVELSHGASMMKASLAHAYVLADHRDLAKGLIAELESQARSQYVPSAEIALPYAPLGRRDKAFELLFRSVDEHSVCLVLADVDPRLKPLRGDPRFEQLREAIGLARITAELQRH